jgi:hypothetical protein
MRNALLVLIAAALVAGGPGSILAQTSTTKNNKPGDQGGKAKETEIIILLQPTTKSGPKTEQLQSVRRQGLSANSAVANVIHRATEHSVASLIGIE